MKRKIITAALLFLSLLTFGCSKDSQTFLSYQSEAFDAKATLDIRGEKYSVEIKKELPDTYTITFLSPDTLKGVSIEKNKDQILYSVGNVHLPIEEDSNITAKTTQFFNLSQNTMSSTEKQILNGTKVNIANFATDYGNVKLFISAQTNLPLRFEASINGTPVSLNISEFNVKQSTT